MWEYRLHSSTSVNNRRKNKSRGGRDQRVFGWDQTGPVSGCWWLIVCDTKEYLKLAATFPLAADADAGGGGGRCRYTGAVLGRKPKQDHRQIKNSRQVNNVWFASPALKLLSVWCCSEVSQKSSLTFTKFIQTTEVWMKSHGASLVVHSCWGIKNKNRKFIGDSQRSEYKGPLFPQ